jgi:hypothetical protein
MIFLKRIGFQSFLQKILNFMSTFELDNGLFLSPDLMSKTSPQLFLSEMIFESYRFFIYLINLNLKYK